MRECEVYIHDKLAGKLTESDNPFGYRFEYYDEYFRNSENPPICLSMPLNQQVYESPHLFPFFFNMLSEGNNREMHAAILGIDREDDFGIMLATAQNDTIGAVTIRPIQK